MTLLPLRAGFVPLLDMAPLAVAREIGFAEEEGLDLQLVPARSWSMLRDMLAFGQVEAAHMLAPLPVAAAMGLGGTPARLDVLQVLSVNGSAVTVSAALAARMRSAGHPFDFADAHAARAALRAAAAGRLRFGVPFPFSTHAELLWLWLGDQPGGFDVTTVPPPRMAEALAAGEVDAFCVGEPWGSTAVETGAGVLLLPGRAIWAAAPEKVLCVRGGWPEENPDLTRRLMRAVWRAGRWLSDRGNRMTLSEVLWRRDYVGVLPEVLDRVLSGQVVLSPMGEVRQVPAMIGFFEGAATFPWRSQAAFFATRLADRLGHDRVDAARAARAVFRTDLYRSNLRDAGADLPGASEKVEGALHVPTAVASERGQMILPPDAIFDGTIFDPATVA
ncbi:MAG: ABC transporter substrate-binding protein [Rhodobacteraceae bacterium]|jgi:NitT/TauT family transport system ATP-binding protein|nr:ABC transporter substrate-binding protein [Paracoccaceae bacterium]